MQNDKIIEIITAAKKNIDGSTADLYNKFKASAPDAICYARSVYALIDALARIEYYTQEDIKSQAAKSAGRADVKKLLEKVCKSAEKIRPGSPMSKDAHDDAGRQIVCDGYRLYRITEPVELAAEYTGTGLDNPAVKFASKIDASDYTRELPVPTAADLKIIITDQKAKNKASKSKCKVPAIYDFGDGLPAVNAEYLLDVINLYGENVKLTAAASNLSPIFIESETGDGLLFPVKKPAAAEKTA